MTRTRPRHFLLGLAATAARPAGAITVVGSRAWRHPVAVPVRLPATALYDAMARRGVRMEAVLEGEAERRLIEALELLLAVAQERRVAERITDAALADGTLERLVERALESHVAAAVAAQVAESEPVRQVVSSVARSPEVREALTAQSSGLANELADQMRDRTARVDNVLERTARRLTRRGELRDPVVSVPADTAQ